MIEDEEFSFMEEEFMESKKPRRERVALAKKATLCGLCFGLSAGVAFSVVQCARNIAIKQQNQPEKITLQISAHPTTQPEETDKEKSSKVKDKKDTFGFAEMQDFYKAKSTQARRRGRGHGSRVRAAAPERRDVVSGAHALKTGDEDDLPRVQLTAHALHRETADVRVAVCLIRADACLPAGERHGGKAHFLERHRHERDACLLAGGEQHVELAL